MRDYTKGAVDFAEKLLDKCTDAMNKQVEPSQYKKDFSMDDLVQLSKNRELLGFQLMIRELLDEFLEDA